jgi:hypothetical protein
VYSPWINSLLEGYNHIVVDALKCLCAPGLGEDDYERMTIKDIPNNWPDYLDIDIENLNNHILPSLKYSPNELMLGLIVNSRSAENPDNRVEHGYTVGRVFPHRTCTCVHRYLLQVVPALYRNSHSVQQNPWYLGYPWFLFIKIVYIHI